jgi:UDP-glucose 4-epimerase
VIHFAALKAVGESVEHPLRYYTNNVSGTLRLCEVMRDHDVKNIVFSSSATVYGEVEQMPLREDFPILPATNPYGRTKQMMEYVLRDLAISDAEWNIAILRYFNPIGAHKSGLIGEDPNGVPNNLLPYISQVAVGKRPYLRIWGDDYPTADGTPIRDYIHVTDIALGHIKALEKLAAKPGAVTYNLGTGRGYSVFEVLAAFERACGKEIRYRIRERRPGDLPVSYAATEKAKQELDWVATRDIDDMCVDAWRWQSKNPEGYQ